MRREVFTPAAGGVGGAWRGGGGAMRRKLFTLAAGVSAVLCVGACVMWVRSCDRRQTADAVIDRPGAYASPDGRHVLTVRRIGDDGGGIAYTVTDRANGKSVGS